MLELSLKVTACAMMDYFYRTISSVSLVLVEEFVQILKCYQTKTFGLIQLPSQRNQFPVAFILMHV